jgi:pyruvate,orthophosphate dikinase
MPKSYAELLKVRQILEKHFKDVQDVEFTIQEGKLFMLQTRNGKRTAAAALKFSMDMVKEKLIDWETAIMRNPADQLDQLLAPDLRPRDVKKAKAIATGLPAGPGAASGKIYLNADRAASPSKRVRRFFSSATNQPRRSSRHDRRRRHPHGQGWCVIARGARRPSDGQGLHLRCCCSRDRLRQEDRHRCRSDLQRRRFPLHRRHQRHVYGGQLKTGRRKSSRGMLHGDKAAQATEKFKSFQQLMIWCGKATRLQVRTNADNPEQTRTPSRSVPRASASPARSTCSSKVIASTLCVR